MRSTKQIARQIFLEALKSIDIPTTMERKLQFEGSRLVLPDTTIDLARFSRVLVIGIGKASHAMAGSLATILPNRISPTGVVVAPTDPAAALPDFEYFLGGHPLPNADSWRAGEAVLRLLRTCDERALAFFLLSGGGSALFEVPLNPDMTLEDVRAVHRALVTCGAPIDAMNTVRRHLSAVKGGRLAVAAGPAAKVTLAATDVPVGKEAALASGPTLPDPTTIADVERIFGQYELRKRLPAALLRWLDAGLMPETPKSHDPAFTNSHFLLLLGMEDLFHAAHHAAEAHGYLSCCDNSTDDWGVEKAADNLLLQLEEWKRSNRGQRVALIADGELSSPVSGNGVGGRNSAFVLACVEKIAGQKVTVLSAGTDGIDGNSPAAGAVADGETLARAKALGFDPAAAFRQSDAYSFFARLDDAITTGPTGNNLRDLRLLLAEP
jgi:hydroxypyruvate reductase